MVFIIKIKALLGGAWGHRGGLGDDFHMICKDFYMILDDFKLILDRV